MPDDRVQFYSRTPTERNTMRNSTTSNATTYQASRSHCRDAEIQRSRYAPSLTPACYCRQIDCHQYQSEVAAGGRR